MSTRFGKWFDLYFNKFGHDLSYNQLMKMVPLEHSEKSDVYGQNIAVILALTFYLANHGLSASDTYRNLGENNLEALFVG